MRLSKKGWNNVLIFGVLLIGFLFNFNHKLLLKPKIHQRSVISHEQTIVEIQTPDFSIKRVGRNWISEPDLGLSELQLRQLVYNWQYLILDTTPPVSKQTSSFLINVYVASKTQPIMVELFQDGDNYLLQTDKQTAMQLNESQLPLLLGR